MMVRRIFRMLDRIVHGADGHAPVHVLLTYAAEILGLPVDGREGMVRNARCPASPSNALTGPVPAC